MSSHSPLRMAPYARIANTYEQVEGEGSCWGLDTARIVKGLRLQDGFSLVVDMGCGAGDELRHLAGTASPLTRLVGVEPSPTMRARAAQNLQSLHNVEIVDGFFEKIPLVTGSVDYMYSINAFQWVSDVDTALLEMRRVLKPTGLMDHYFTGRDIGREFIRVTTPIFLRYLGPHRLLQSARLRQNLTLEAAKRRFAAVFDTYQVWASESYDTYYDSVEGHLAWWRRVEPQLVGIPTALRADCEDEVRDALASLETDQGVPYTKHTLHIHLHPA
jgi:ubiquinone/menaquinone biosynthesis C-methylase UbiE